MKAISDIVRGAVKAKSIIVLFLVMLIVVGIYGLLHINKDELPTFEIKQGLIAAVYPGADAAEVEEQLGKPLERLLFSIPEIKRSATKVCSRDGICYIYTDLTSPASSKTQVWNKIRHKINEFKLQLPPGVLAVVVLDDFSAVTSVLVALESSDKGYSEMKEYAETLSDRLRMIPELANVQVIGTRDEEIAVTADMEKLSAYGLSPSALSLNVQSGNLQLLGSSFSAEYTNTPVHVPPFLNSEREAAETIVLATPDNNVLRLKDVAKVERRLEKPSSFVRYNGHSAVILSIEMRPGNDIVSFGEEVNRVMEEFSANLPDSVSVTRITDQPKVVSDSVWSFLRDLVISMLVVIMVMLMLFPLRSALIASSGVPVCTALALALMYLCGITLNTVSLAALIVVLGMIVDDSVITMDGYMDKLSKGMPRLEAACASARELFMPMFTATLSISLMFLPMTRIIKGYLGDFVQTFPWVILFALMASLAYAVLIVPSLEIKYISSATPNRITFFSKMQEKMFALLQRAYDNMQNKCFAHPYATLGVGLGTIVLAFFLFSRLNVQMMPMAARPVFAVEVYLDPTAGLEKTSQLCDSLSCMFRKDARVVSVTEFIGTGAPRFHCTYAPILPGRNVAQLIVNTSSNRATEELLHEWETKYEHWFPEATLHFKQMDYQGVPCPVEVRISGESFEQILPVAEQVKSYMESIDELKWVHSDADNFLPGINVEMDADEAARLGINRSMLSVSLAGQLQGVKMATLYEGGKGLDVNLYCESFSGGSEYETIGDVRVPAALTGSNVPLRQVADLVPQWQPETYVRVDGEAAITVGGDMKYAQSQPVAAKKIKKFIRRELQIPEGVTVTTGGLDASNKEVIPQIAASFLAAVLVLFIFLVFHFKKVSLSVLTMLLSSLCLFGAFFGLWIFGLDFSITAVLGLVSLVGIIVRNGIIMFEYAEELRSTKGLSVRQAAEQAGKRRMRPIFLTSCTTALGVLPMIIVGDTLWQPLGVVICFGTMLSILLITLIMPISYWFVYKGQDNKCRI